MNKFFDNTKPRDSNIDYYTSALPINIAQFVKRTARQTLTDNYEEAIAIKDLHAIRVITDDESTKDSKDTGKRPQASMSKAKEKKPNDIESLTHLMKSLTNEMDELKQRTSETTIHAHKEFNFRQQQRFVDKIYTEFQCCPEYRKNWHGFVLHIS